MKSPVSTFLSHHLSMVNTPPHLLFLIKLLIIIIPSFASCSFVNPSSQKTMKEMGTLLDAEKTRLGSRPPSCHNKCNRCHPCWAVQVPTLPSHSREQLIRRSRRHDYNNDDNDIGSNNPRMRNYKFGSEFYDFDELKKSAMAGSGSNRYSNYKPLGWKCHCRGHFYNP
ncbi:hypothetical protein Droror1_Dr00015242 [Drosera rotundifolia]